VITLVDIIPQINKLDTKVYAIVKTQKLIKEMIEVEDKAGAAKLLLQFYATLVSEVEKVWPEVQD